jgi:hypothetical protein
MEVAKLQFFMLSPFPLCFPVMRVNLLLFMRTSPFDFLGSVGFSLVTGGKCRVRFAAKLCVYSVAASMACV